jgi:hypothetical protein
VYNKSGELVVNGKRKAAQQPGGLNRLDSPYLSVTSRASELRTSVDISARFFPASTMASWLP